jgi:hypothetical protein
MFWKQETFTGHIYCLHPTVCHSAFPLMSSLRLSKPTPENLFRLRDTRELSKNQFPCKIPLTSAFVSHRHYQFQHGDIPSPRSRKEQTASPSSRHVCICTFIGRLVPSVDSNCVMVLFSKANIENYQKKKKNIWLNHQLLPRNFRGSQGRLSPLTTAEKKRDFFSVQKQRVQ